MSPQFEARFRQGSRMNRKRVIVLMTLAVFFLLGWLMITIFNGFPPWPFVLAFTVSHAFFCIVIASVKPYRGPYTKPMADPELPHWPARDRS